MAAQIAGDKAVGKAVGRAVCRLENRAENKALNRSENRSENRPKNRSARQIGKLIAYGRVECRAGGQVAGRKGPEGWAGLGKYNRQVMA